MREHSLSLGGLQVSWDEPADGRAGMALAGELDHLSAPALRQAFDHVAERGCHDVHLDLGRVSFVDSSGISELVAVWRRCQREGGAVTLANPIAPVRRILEMTGVADMLAPPA